MKIFTMLFILTIITTIINFDGNYKSRYFYQIKSLLSINGYSKFMKESQYGAHRNAAIKIFKENLYFGVGIKNFRYEVWDKKYENKEYAQTNKRYATHPHQIHHELLSETGILGYISFIIFILFSLYLGIKSFLKTKNLYQLSGIIFIITSILPIIPTGSFMSTFSSGIFWFNFALMASFIRPRF
jgi:O-antigen ligase